MLFYTISDILECHFSPRNLSRLALQQTHTFVRYTWNKSAFSTTICIWNYWIARAWCVTIFSLRNEFAHRRYTPPRCRLPYAQPTIRKFRKVRRWMRSLRAQVDCATLLRNWKTECICSVPPLVRLQVFNSRVPVQHLIQYSLLAPSCLLPRSHIF